MRRPYVGKTYRGWMKNKHIHGRHELAAGLVGTDYSIITTTDGRKPMKRIENTVVGTITTTQATANEIEMNLTRSLKELHELLQPMSFRHP